MPQLWLDPRPVDVETERLQCEQEGRDLTSVQTEFDRLAASPLTSSEDIQAFYNLLDTTIRLPIQGRLALCEPSDLDGIRNARPSPVRLLTFNLDEAALLDRLHGAWLGRCTGCLLGKPVEGWRKDKLWPYLKEQNQWPLNSYIEYASAPDELKARLGIQRNDFFADLVDSMPEDDDLNYTTTGLAIFEQYGSGFTAKNVGEFWQKNIPILNTCTAERIAYRNLDEGLAPPASATHRNPYREWIGAQIRADFWGYVSPGNPELAAEYAWRDASVSHVKNGMYGEMWAAAMVSAAFATDDIETAIRAGLAQIPSDSRLALAIEDVLEWKEVDCDYDTAAYRVHELWNEKREHDWCHTIPNAMIVAIALLYGEKDFGQTICKAVQPCFDTDCNGATAGSVLGAMVGAKALPTHWTAKLNDTLHTGVSGYEKVSIAAMAQKTLELLRRK